MTTYHPDYFPSINEPPPADAVAEAVTPVITALTPDSCVIGDADFTLYVSGEKFGESSEIMFAEQPEPTTLNADGTLSTGVKPSLWSAAAVVKVVVCNGALVSEPMDFTFTAPATREGAGYGRRNR
jgi:hypothetical protein